MVDEIKNIVIVGGGTAGWMSAALIAKVMGKNLTITLIESEDIGTIGVGEATIPPIQNFNSVLGIDEAEFVKETKATFKLAIKFEGWRTQSSSYFHTFGASGKNMTFCSFNHLWLRAKHAGIGLDYWDYDLNYLACLDNKFAFAKSGSNRASLPYAYHFDSTLYAKYLRKYSERLGVKRVEGLIQTASVCAKSGNITSLKLKNGEVVSGDFFIDCSGARGVLIKQHLHVGYEDWSHWLPCDRAVAIASEPFETTVPYTRSIAHKAGWQWQIPLQHRNGNGLVYSSEHYSDEEAVRQLTANLGSAAISEPKVIRFNTGRSRLQWSKNVVAIGMSSGFLEPLESTSIYLIQSAIVRLLHLFPNSQNLDSLAKEYNRQSKIEYDLIRDFIILHYHQNNRSDGQFWDDLRSMEIPSRLRHKIALFVAQGEYTQEQYDIFFEPSWAQVMIGQGLTPKEHHPVANVPSIHDLESILDNLNQQYRGLVSKMESHDVILDSLTRDRDGS